MATSKRLGELIGPAMIVLAITEAMNLGIWAAPEAPVIYLNGTILFVVGLAIVRAHNRWTFEWPIVVTLTGWVTMFGGLFRMFFPNARQAPDTAMTFAGFAVLGTLGLFVTFKAYTLRTR